MSDKKNIARRLNLQTGLGVNWSDNFRMQDGLISNRGQVLIHEIGISCTCRSGGIVKSTTSAPNKFACSKCENGIMYRKPLQIMGLILGISTNRQLVETGFITRAPKRYTVRMKTEKSTLRVLIFTSKPRRLSGITPQSYKKDMP
jgi:hypothetical protein